MLLSLQSVGLISLIATSSLWAEPAVMQPVEAVAYQELPPPWELGSYPVVQKNTAHPTARVAQRQNSIPAALPIRSAPVVSVSPQVTPSPQPVSLAQRHIRTLINRAEQGDVRAQYELGKRYQYGSDVAKSRTKAHHWLYKASEAGLPEAKYALAMFYQKYVKTTQGTRKSLLLLKKSADSGYAEAQYALGVMFQRGTIVNANPVEARKWLQLAARQGHTTAQVALR